MTLGEPVNAMLSTAPGANAAEASITDRIPLETGDISLSVDVTQVRENVSPAPSVTVTATVEGDAYEWEQQVGVGIGVFGATTTEYTATPADFTITIPRGRTSASGSFVLAPSNDSADEHDEIIPVVGSLLGNVPHLNVHPTSILLVDDDDAPVLAIDSPSQPEGGGALRYKVSLTPASGRHVKVDYEDLMTGSATRGRDYALPASGTLAFAPGVTEQAIEVAIHDDNLREPSETIDLRLSAPVNAGFAGSATTLDATGTITDDETAPGGLTLSVDLDPNAPGDQTSLAENRSATATVTATLASGVAFTEAKAVTVTVGRAGDTASSADYAAVAPFKIDIPAGAISASETFDFNPVDDSDDEGDETLTVSGAAGGGLSVSPSAIALTLIDDDTRTLSIDSPQVADVAGGSSATLSFTVSLSAASARTVTVDYADTG
ncbi:MAG: hypothetical protein F4X06_11430, partial [Gammaproteobacteria bacterium]|nr:hypothetical protein [Gammaproteobacteria bacterium]